MTGDSTTAAYLRLQLGDGDFQDYPLPTAPGEAFRIGRASDANMRFDDDAYSFLSDEQCQIVRTPAGDYQITDGKPGGVPSVVGTLVNSNPVGMSAPVTLTHGDWIALGSGSTAVEMQFRTGMAPRSAPAYQPTASGMPDHLPYDYRYGDPPQAAPGSSLHALAGAGGRITAFIIDNVILVIATTILISIISPMPQPDDFFLQTAYDDAVSDWLLGASILGFVLQSLYHVIVVYQTNGRTIGKSLMGIRIVKADGQPITLSDALMRNVLGYFASGFVLYLGYFWAFIDPQRRAWHDHIAKTFVVQDSRR